jgi:ferrochelatase
MNQTGVLLVNLGTPKSPKPKDVFRYLVEFLTDSRVVDIPWLQRQLLVRGLIVPRRYKMSAKAYQQVWTKEGSPLMVYGNQVQKALQSSLGSNYKVELAMRYQEPSIRKTLDALLKHQIKHLIVVPLFPQYASATTGSVLQSVQENLSRYQVIPKITMIDHFFDHPKMIAAFCEVAKSYDLGNYDHILFSFHGLPERHLKKADRNNHCRYNKSCCNELTSKNVTCYSAQCYGTAKAIAKDLGLSQDSYEISFQSRLGKDPWLKPYTSEVIENLAKAGKKKVLVFCPSFVCDCLETIYEIGMEYSEEFKHAGGERLDLVPGLNAHPMWIEALKDIVLG